MTKVPDVKFPYGTHPTFYEFYDYVQVILNNGRYQLRVVNSVPNWIGEDGEMVCYDPETTGRKSIYIYIVDGWYRVTFLSSTTSGGDRYHHVGEMFAWGGDHTDAEALPANTIVCNGAAVSRSVYSELFAVVGTSFGVGDGSTTFNVPDFRGRFILGCDNMGGTSANRATDVEADSVGGSEGDEDGAGKHSHDVKWGFGGAGGVYVNGTPGGLGEDAGSPGSDMAEAQGTDITTGGNMPPYMATGFLIQA